MRGASFRFVIVYALLWGVTGFASGLAFGWRIWGAS